jgi:hypothetical protein rflaF_09327
MKNFKRFTAAIAATLMAASLSIPMAMNVSASDYQITVNLPAGATAEYNAYRIFDLSYNADKTAYKYTVAASGGFTEEQILTPNYNGTGKFTSIDDLMEWLNDAGNSETNARTFADLLYTSCKENLPTAIQMQDGVIDTGTPGYFLIVGTTNNDKNQAITSAVMLTNTDPTGEVTPKLDYPTLTKQIEHDELNTFGTVGDNQIGDIVNYKINTTMPDPKYVAYFDNEDGTNSYKYVIHDNMTKGLTFNANSVSIIIGEHELTAGTHYTVSTSCKHTSETDANKTGFEIKFNLAKIIKDYPTFAVKNAEITTTYNCTLNADALVATGANDTTNHNDNTSYLEYSNNPYVTSDTGKSPEVEVYDWTFAETVTKVDGENKGLAGATFLVYDVDPSSSGATALTFTKGTDETYTIDPNGTEPTTITSVANSGFVLKGLDDSKTYYVVEQSAPDGYTKAEARTFVLTSDYNKDGTVGTTLTKLEDDGKADDNTPDNNLTIINTSGDKLPSTGGIGTTLFYIGGGCMVAVAGIFLITKKRMSKNAD